MKREAEAEAGAGKIGFLPSQPNGISQQVNAPTMPETITDVSGSTSNPVKESGGFKDSLQNQTKNNTCIVNNDTTGHESSDELKEADLETKNEREGFWRRLTAYRPWKSDCISHMEIIWRKLTACLTWKSKQNFSALEEATLGSAVTDATVDVNRYVDTTKRTNDDDIEIHEGFSGDKVSIIGPDRSSSLERSPAGAPWTHRPSSLKIPKSAGSPEAKRASPRPSVITRRCGVITRPCGAEVEGINLADLGFVEPNPDELSAYLMRRRRINIDGRLKAKKQGKLHYVEPNPGIKRPPVTILQPPPPPPTL